MGKPPARDGNVYIKWIETRLAELNLSQRALARHMRWTPSAVSRTLSGERSLKASEIALAATLLGPPPGASGVDATKLPTYAEVPIVDRATMSQWSPSPLPPQGRRTAVVTTHRFPARDQVGHEIDSSLHGSDELGSNTHVFSVLAATHRPRPSVGDLFVVTRHQDAGFSPTGKLVNAHIFRAELRGTGICLVGFDKSEITEPFPPDMRWIIGSYKDLAT